MRVSSTRGRQAVFDQESPKTLGIFFVEDRHGEIGQDCGGLVRTASPDRAHGEKTTVEPIVSELEFFGRHASGAENDVRGVVFLPVAMEKACLRVPFRCFSHGAGGLLRLKSHLHFSGNP
jgi:hypothetical protein